MLKCALTGMTPEETYKIPEVKAIRQLFDKYPKIRAQYLADLDALDPEKVQSALQDVSLGNNDRKIITFDDGSFIILESRTTNEAMINNVVEPCDPLPYHLSHDYTYSHENIACTYILHLITELDSGHYWVNVTDAKTTASGYGVNSISHYPQIIKAGDSYGKTRGTFQVTSDDDISWTVILETRVDAGAYGAVDYTDTVDDDDPYPSS